MSVNEILTSVNLIGGTDAITLKLLSSENSYQNSGKVLVW
jgi:hypothetical protein